MGFIEFTKSLTEVKSWIDDKLDNADSEMQILVYESLNLFKLLAEVLSPFKSGALAGSHEIEIFGMSGIMFPNVLHAIFYILGTPPHTICPRTKASLYWEELGHPLPKGRCVEHPGFEGRDYMEGVYDAGMASVEAQIREYRDWMIR